MSGATFSALAFEVRRDDLTVSRIVEEPAPTPACGQVLLRVERFGFTANNVTYALLGEDLGYWTFYPATDGWGRIPVWGFAEVVASAHSALPEGARVFGYLPMATHLLLEPGRVDAAWVRDASPHRASLPAAYNSYRRPETDPGYDPVHEDQQIILRPLFFLAFLLDDYLAENHLFGAQTILLSSASSKTALGTAFLASRRDIPTIGLTSPRNVEFVRALDVYENTIGYDEIRGLADGPVAFVDLAGNGNVRNAVHRHYGDRLCLSSLVGATHWDSPTAAGDDLPGPTPRFFFAPDQLAARTRTWGQEGVDARMSESWRAFLAWSRQWLTIDHARGPDAVRATYRDVLSGETDPGRSRTFSLQAAGAENSP